MINSILTFKIEKKYLLIPVEDGSSLDSELEVEIDGSQELKMMISVAKSKIDYWIPINVAKYRGREVDLIFKSQDKVERKLNDIKQSDSFCLCNEEQYRPIYHFSPLYGWMNDPNGMVYLNDEFQLYYQYNPYGSRWGNMHWGHASSKDLVRWKHHQVALSLDSLGAIFSGSAIVDKENSAGFGENTLIAIYTTADKIQSQNIAYSFDGGLSFIKYENNPVLSDPSFSDFRDPKVIWHDETKQWIMSLSTSQTITFYGSSNLKNWYKLSEFGEGIGAHGGVWECPDLIKFKTENGLVKWVLLVSINPGGPNGGSATQYFIGSFDGRTFRAEDLKYPLWLDYGRDNYAGVTWSNVPTKDGRHLFIGWMSNWDYANDVPSINFRGSMTIPRELKIQKQGANLLLVNNPIIEMSALRSQCIKEIRSIDINRHLTIGEMLSNNNGAYEINMTIKSQKATIFSFKLKNEYNEFIDFKFDLNLEQLFIDRTQSSLKLFNNNFASVIAAPLESSDMYKIRLFIDKASSELFVNDGILTSTNLIFPTNPYNSFIIESDNNIRLENMVIYELK